MTRSGLADCLFGKRSTQGCVELLEPAKRQTQGDGANVKLRATALADVDGRHTARSQTRPVTIGGRRMDHELISKINITVAYSPEPVNGQIHSEP